MKLIKNIMLLLALGLFAACETDIDTPQINSSDKFVAPVMGQCSDVIVNADNSKDETVVFSWKAADFGLPVQVLYTVYLTDGTKTGSVGNSSSTSYAITKGDLNGVVIGDLGIAPNETVEVKAYVTARFYGTDEYEELVSNYSNSFKVTTYAAPLKALYAVGAFNGWSEVTAVEFWENGAGTNVYETMIDLTDGGNGNSGFKILTERSWNGEGNWGYDAFTVGDGITQDDDGNLVVKAGIWQISVNKTAMSIDVKKVTNVDILGSFNGWNETAGHTPLKYDAAENVWVSDPVSFEANGEFLIRLNASWDNKYGSSGVNSTAIADGLELLTGEGDNISVPSAGTYVIKLYANRTPYVVKVIKQ